MPTRNVVLTDQQHQLIETLVQSGRYQNASEVLREGLRLIERHASIDATRRQALQDAAKAGWTDIEAGRYTDVPDTDLEDFIGQIGQRAGREADA